MTSPVFSSFREFMDSFLLVENDLCLFFKKDGILYGTTETGRITYARMKSPESKEDEAWKKDATFVAYDLSKSAEGQKSMSVFNSNDLKKIEVIGQEQAEKELKSKGKKMPAISDDEEQTYGEE